MEIANIILSKGGVRRKGDKDTEQNAALQVAFAAWKRGSTRNVLDELNNQEYTELRGVNRNNVRDTVALKFYIELDVLSKHSYN